jgi:hypothetical protein
LEDYATTPKNNSIPSTKQSPSPNKEKARLMSAGDINDKNSIMPNVPEIASQMVQHGMKKMIFP